MIFCNKFGDKTLSCQRCKCSIGSVKSLPTLSDTCLDHMLVKFEQNRTVRNIKKYELFNGKRGFLKLFFKRFDVIFEDVSVTETIVEC